MNCESRCDCSDVTACDAATGQCKCASGLTGPRCDQACPTNQFGPSCSLSCDCGENADGCDPFSGCCQCKPGWYGPQCNFGKYTSLDVTVSYQNVIRQTSIIAYKLLHENVQHARYESDQYKDKDHTNYQ